MEWFMKKNDPLSKSQPHVKKFHQTTCASFGQPQTILLTIYVDGQSSAAPLAKNANVKILCLMKDLARYPFFAYAVLLRGKTT
ncbi:hypothetical protein BJ170DRAFT_688585 [Xylariales sp. AK1849]|nr:hypothetical protein BJ170DRAFT_688585 [Xylariales sp. AK1849]